MARSFAANTSISNSSYNPGGYSGSWTMACWFLLTAPIGAFGNQQLFIIPSNVSGTARITLKDGDGGSHSVLNGDYPGSSITGNIFISLNTWHHAAAVWNGGTFGEVFLDGADAGGGAAFVGGAALASGTVTAQVQAAGTPVLVADAAIWAIQLSAGELTALANGARPRDIRPQALVTAGGLWWPFDGLQSPEPDLSGNGFNGTISGSVTLAASGPPVMQFTPRWPMGSILPSPITADFSLVRVTGWVTNEM